MADHEPEITQIAAVFADRLPNDEKVERPKAVQAWRKTLRYARSAGLIDELAAKITESDPEDRVLTELCAAVCR